MGKKNINVYFLDENILLFIDNFQAQSTEID